MMAALSSERQSHLREPDEGGDDLRLPVGRYGSARGLRPSMGVGVGVKLVDTILDKAVRVTEKHGGFLPVND
ncbi:MAG: hypothetical protein K8J31_20205 [Anaerolineae bacterium]|nr:hypothetical protein [Anaerolineae bacterium]